MRLERAEDGDFDWLGGRTPAPKPLRVAPGLSPPEVLAIVRTLPANWLMIVDDEVVGIIGVKAFGDDRRSPEIGYGTAESRRGLGYASRAVGLLLQEFEREGLTQALAETSVDNLPSQRVLLANGFEATGRRDDEEDGPLICWRRGTPSSSSSNHAISRAGGRPAESEILRTSDR